MQVSVIIPTFNRIEVLPRAINSVIKQGLDNMEIIVVDDGSTDGSSDLVRNQYPGIKLIIQKNLGVSSARNTAIKQAQGQWIALLDSDDEWLDGKLVAQLSKLAETQLKICHTEEIWIRNGVRVNQMNKHAKSGGYIFKQCLPLCAMSPSSIIIHRSVFEHVGGFDESFPACEDYDLWLRICALYEVAFLETPFIRKYGGHDDQLSRQYWGMDRFRVNALDKLLNRTDFTDQLSCENQDAAIAMLLKKIKILLKGAIKHNNVSLEAECRDKLKKWGAHD